MGNQASVRAHTRRGDEILVHRLAHVVVHEQGGVSALSGVQPNLLDGERGMLDVATLEAAWHDASDPHYARQTLVCVENTVGEAGGLVVPAERIREIAAFARRYGMRLHMDGARLWNAAVALGVPPAELVTEVDTVSVCFSKGLGAPVGSAVAGSSEVIAEVRRNRKLFGGGMRQAGIIAAGALHALRHHFERLADDHRNARRLAEGLRGAGRIEVIPEAVETNIVLAHMPEGSAEALVTELGEAGVLAGALDAHTVRFVTHLDVPEAAVGAALEAMTPLLR
jgi:threonine aldolase